MKDREFKINEEICYSLLNMLYVSDQNPLQRYLNQKKDNETNIHLDYVYKKEVVLGFKSKKKEQKRENDQLNPLTPISDGSLKIMDLKLGSSKNNLPDVKEQFTREISSIQCNIFSNDHPLNSYIKLCESLNWSNDSLYMDITNNLIVGLGEPNIVETSMTIHHTYGIPYIPGQAVKGMFRNYFLTKLIKDKKNSGQLDGFKKKISSVKLYEIIFGDILEKDNNQDDNRKGSVIFFDAFPYERCTISKDIMTPHYASYYSGSADSPRDTENPIPIPFYVVKNTTFVFHYGIRDEMIAKVTEMTDDKKLQADAGITVAELNLFIREHLQTALEEQGIGAKTSVGYGYLKNNQKMYEEEKKKLLKKKKEEQLKKAEIVQQKNEEANLAAMSEVEKLLYNTSALPEEQRSSRIPALLIDIDEWSIEDQQTIARYVKKYLQNVNKWFLKQTYASQSKKGKKNAKCVIKICSILDEELPVRSSS